MRRLLLFSISFSLTALLLTFFYDSTVCTAVCAFLCLLSLVFFILRNTNDAVYRLFLVVLGAAGSIASFVWYSHTVTDPCRQLDGITCTVSAYVTDYPESGDGYQRVELCLIPNEQYFTKEQNTQDKQNSTNKRDDANDQLYSETQKTSDNPDNQNNPDIPHAKLLLYDNSYSYHLTDLQPGDCISCTVKFKSSDIRYGEPYYSLYSSGVFLTGTIHSDYCLTDHRTDLLSDLILLPVRLRHIVLETADEVFSTSVRPFMKSLLLNDRHDFYADPDLSLSMSRAGIMHIVAVSGMHIAFLVGFLKTVFGNRKWSSVLCLLFIWLFVLMSGAPASAVRAGFMQSMILLASLSGRENDPPTSLFFALFVILFLNPWAARSVSLQLSFGAVLGLILFSHRIYARLTAKAPFDSKNLFVRLWRYAAGAVAGSVGVMIPTVPLCAYHFGTVQLLSIVTNILVLWAVSLCFGLGYFAVFAARLFPLLTPLFAVPAEALARYITTVAEKISSLRYSVLYCINADSAAVWFIVAVYAVFILFCFLPLPRRRKTVVPCLLTVVLFCALITGTKLKYDLSDSVFNVIDIGQGQCLAVYAGDKTVMVDCGSTFTSDNAGTVAGQYLQSCQRFHVDQLILTHLHEDHVSGVGTLFQYVDIDEILLPADLIRDTDFLPVIRAAADAHGTELVFVEDDMQYSVGNIVVRLFRSTALSPAQLSSSVSNTSSVSNSSSDENEQCLLCLLSVDDYDMLVTADSSKKTEETLLQCVALPEVDLLVIGHHGSRYSSSEALLEFCSSADGVISTGYNTYGHPAQETLDSASRTLSSLYRTDRDGTVQFIRRNGDLLSWLKNRLNPVTTGTN